MADIVVAPRAYVPDAELARLLDDLRALGFEVELRPWVPPEIDGRSAAPWWENIEVHVTAVSTAASLLAQTPMGKAALEKAKSLAGEMADDAIKALARKIGGVFVGWAQRRAQLPGKNPKRPKVIKIYGPDGKTVVRTVIVTDSETAPEEHDGPAR
jgi:hypothetical protein